MLFMLFLLLGWKVFGAPNPSVTTSGEIWFSVILAVVLAFLLVIMFAGGILN